MAHMNLKPLLLARSGVILFETLAKCENILSAERKSKETKLTISCYFECPLHKPDIITDWPSYMDAVALLSFQSARKYADTFSVGIEIKDSVADMYHHPGQFEKYLGYTDYLFLGVRTDLVQAALLRVKDIPECGVFDLNTGKVYKASVRQNNGVAIQKRLYDTFLAAIFSNGNVDTIRAPRSLGANVLDLSDVPQDEEKRQRFWSTIREIISTRDYIIDKLPKEKRMTAYYDISRKTQEDLLRDKFQ